MHSPFADKAAPRYLQIADLMRKRIARDIWQTGDKLPSLEALMAEFGVARVTVRQAVELLVRDGLVSPQQGRGTFVTSRPPQRQWQREWLTVHATVDDLAKAYRDTQPRIVNIEESIAHAPLTPDDGIPAERYVLMHRVHSEGDEPYCVINIHLDEAIFRKQPARFRAEPVVPLLAAMRKGGVASARQALTIGSADLDVARHLRVRVGDPVAEVRRVFCDEHNRVIYLGEVTYRGDLFRLEMDLVPPKVAKR